MPKFYRYGGTLGQERIPDASSERGGTFIGIRRELVARGSQSYVTMCARGKALTWSLMLVEWTHFTVVHFGPSLSMRQRVGLLRRIGSILMGVGGRIAVMGGWSFVLSGEGSGETTCTSEHVASHFASVLGDNVELMKHGFIHRRLGRMEDTVSMSL